MTISNEQMQKISQVVEKIEKMLDSKVLLQADIQNINQELNDVIANLRPIKYFERIA